MKCFKKFSFFVALCLLISNSYAQSLPNFIQLVKKYDASVVNISTTTKAKTATLPNLNIPELENSPFGELLKRFLERGQGQFAPDKQETASLGSGFVISADGYILTNNHVVDNADKIIVSMVDRREFVATLVGVDKRSDIALLKIDADGLQAVEFGKSSDLEVGEWVLAIGSPFGFEHTATAGIVSAIGRALPNENYVPFIQTDVAINPGNSGGPLFNMQGKVIGINSQIYSRTGGFMGLSFAIPIDMALDVVKQLKDNGRVSRGWLGVLIQEISGDLAESFDMERPEGALIAEILADSPAASSAIQVGDIILSFNGHKIVHSSDLPPVVGRSPIDEFSNMQILRNGKRMNLKIKIGELPSEPNAEVKKVTKEKQKYKANKLGIEITQVPALVAKSLHTGNKGVYVKKVIAGTAKDAGIKQGDVILQFNYQKIESANHLDDLIEEIGVGRTVPVLVQRESGPIFLAMKIK